MKNSTIWYGIGQLKEVDLEKKGREYAKQMKILAWHGLHRATVFNICRKKVAYLMACKSY